jgi:DnaD/phage-associated family protein
MLHCAKNDKVPSISTLADIFQCTENDIKRALKYWESKGLLVLTEEPSIPEKEVAPVLEKHTYSAAETKAFKENNEVKQLLFVCEQYMSKQLTRTDIETLLYFYDQLHFSTDLIEYLVEYSVSKNKKSMRYMETVALEWHKKGIKTVEEAKLDSKPYAKECYQVLKALGINNHDPLPSEITYVDRWMKEYGFTIDIILEACNRTIMQIHKPSFEYADGILKSWKSKGVHHLADIERLSNEHKNRTSDKPQQQKAGKPFTTRFHEFEPHNYASGELDKFFINQ